MIEWMREGNPHFEELAAHGKAWEVETVKRLLDEGFRVARDDRGTRESVANRDPYRDGIDLAVWHPTLDVGWTVSVKSRSDRYPYTCASDFPLPTIFVDTARKYREYKPQIVVCWSDTSCAAVWCVPGLYEGEHRYQIVFDGVRGFWEEYVALHKRYWHDGLDSLVATLRQFSVG